MVTDTYNILFKMSLSGVIIESFPLPGENQEGLTFDEEGSIYIAQDSGGILKVVWNKGDLYEKTTSH